MASILTAGKASAIATAVGAATGERPRVVLEDTYARLLWTPDQVRRLRALFENAMSQGPGDIRLEIVPVVAPYIAKRTIPILLGALAVGFLVGRL